MTGLEPFINQIVTALIAFVVGGGLAEVVSARRDARTRSKEVEALGVRTEAEVTDMSMGTLIKINTQLTTDYARVSAERDDLRARFEALSIEVTALREQLENAHSATSKLEVQLKELMKSLPDNSEIGDTDADTE